MTLITLILTAHDEILERLTAIEERLSTSHQVPQKTLTYADTAHLALPHDSHKKPISHRALKEITLKVISDSQPS